MNKMAISNGCLLFTILSPLALGLIMPMKKPNGDPDITSVINHVTLMEQTISSLQTQVQKTNTDLTTCKDKLQTTENELKSTKDEMTAMKAEVRLAETDIAILKHDLQKSPDPTELANLKTELEALKASYSAQMQQINSMLIDVAGADVKTKTKDIEFLNTELLTTRILVNKTAKDIQTTRSDVAHLATRMENRNNELNQTVQEMKSKENITKKDLTETQALIQSTESKVSLVRDRVNTISGNVASLSREVSSLKSKSGQSVAFQVSHASPNPLPNLTTLKFEVLHYNIDNAYNKTSGIFTSPVSGTYIFWANVVYYSQVADHHICIYVRHECIAIGFDRLEATDHYSASSVMAVTHLDKEDQVYFTTDTDSRYIAGYGTSSYGGALRQTV